MTMSEQPPPSKRIRLSKDDLRHILKEDLIARWLEQETYLNTLEDLVHRSDRLGLADELSRLRNSESQLKSQLQDVKKRENVLVLKLAAKEQEANEYRNHIQMLKTSSTPSVTQLKSLLLDPAVNLMFQRMKTEVKDAKKKEKEAQEDLAAWKFTPDSQTGKRLMARCRSLLQENESIGKMIASGRVAKIEGELALQRRLVDEMKSGQAELDVFIAELDEDVEGMQSTIYLLQHQLREARTQMAQLQSENRLLKLGGEAVALCDSVGKDKDDDDNNHSNHLDSRREEPPIAIATIKLEDGSEPDRENEDSNDDGRNATFSSSSTTPAAATSSQPLEEASRRHDEDRVDVDKIEGVKAASSRTEVQGPVSTAVEESVFTLTVKESERQELEDGFDDKGEDGGDDGNIDDAEKEDESGKQTLKVGKTNSSSGGGKNKHQHDGNHFNNNGAAAVKRPYSPDVEEKNSKGGGGKTNGNDGGPSGGRSARSNNAASSPAKKARGASGGRSGRGRRVSVDDAAEDEHEAAEDRITPPSKGRSPRAGSRVGSGTRATRGSAVTNGDAPVVENGMDCD